MIELSEKNQKLVNRMKARYEQLAATGYTDDNAAAKVMHENGNIDGDLVSVATDRYLDPEQIKGMLKRIQ